MSESFSIDQAVESLTSAPANKEDVNLSDVALDAPNPDNAAVEADEITGGDDQLSDDANAAETPAEAKDGDSDAPATVAEAPSFWSAEGKALFATLTPEAQAAILAEENAVKQLTAKKLEGTAAERKAAKVEREKFSQLTARMAEAADVAESTFANRWAGITPEAWAELAKTKPSEYTALKAQFDAEQHAAQQAKAARDDAKQVEHDDWLIEQRERLATLDPALVDPVHGEKNLRELAGYLVSQGVSESDLPQVDALSMSIARKAMLYDAGVAKLAKPAQPPASRPAMKPSGVDGGTSSQRASANAMERLKKSGSIDDAVDALLARK